MMSQKVEHFSKRWVKKWRHFSKKGDESDAPADRGFLVGAA